MRLNCLCIIIIYFYYYYAFIISSIVLFMFRIYLFACVIIHCVCVSHQLNVRSTMVIRRSRLCGFL